MNTEIIKDLFLDAVAEVAYFPVWWYSGGLKKTTSFCLKQIKGGWHASSLSILLVNFFKPMYGQKGFDAYLLSILVRTWQIIWRIIILILWLSLWLSVLVLWVLVLPLILWKLITG